MRVEKAPPVRAGFIFGVGVCFHEQLLSCFGSDLIAEIDGPVFVICRENSTTEIAIPTKTLTNETNSGIETQPLTAEKKNKKMLKVI